MTGVANSGSFQSPLSWTQNSPSQFPYAVDPGESEPMSIRPRSLPALFAQGKHWRRADGTWVRVKDMHPMHRANAARMLLRDAAEYAQKVAMAALGAGLALDTPNDVAMQMIREDHARTSDPEGWMRSTKLYRRLTKGLPDGMRQFEDPNAAHLPPPSDDVPGAPPDSRDAGACPHGFVGSVGCNPCNTGPAAAGVLRRVALPTEHTVTVTSGVWTKVADGVVVIHHEPGAVKLRVMTEQKPPDGGKWRGALVDGGDPVAHAAGAAALHSVLAVVDATTDLISKNPMAPVPAGDVRFTVQDARGMVEHAARRIGVTL